MLRRPVGTVDRPIVAGARGTMRRRCVDWGRDRAVDPNAPSDAARSAFLAAVRAALPDLRLLEDPVDREGYRNDETAYLKAGLPLAVALPTSTAEVATLVRLAAEHRIPIVPRGAGTGLSGGAAGIEGGLTIALTRMDRVLEIDRENLVVVTQPGILNAELKKRGRRGGPVLRSGSGELRDLLDRREPRDERRRAVLREVRPDPRLRPRAGGRPRRRPRHPDRRQERQGRRRLRADAPVRRVAGDARDHHRGDAPAPGRAAAAVDDARLLPVARRRRRRGRARSSRPGSTR